MSSKAVVHINIFERITGTKAASALLMICTEIQEPHRELSPISMFLICSLFSFLTPLGSATLSLTGYIATAYLVSPVLQVSLLHLVDQPPCTRSDWVTPYIPIHCLLTVCETQASQCDTMEFSKQPLPISAASGKHIKGVTSFLLKLLYLCGLSFFICNIRVMGLLMGLL